MQEKSLVNFLWLSNGLFILRSYLDKRCGINWLTNVVTLLDIRSFRSFKSLSLVRVEYPLQSQPSELTRHTVKFTWSWLLPVLFESLCTTFCHQLVPLRWTCWQTSSRPPSHSWGICPHLGRGGCVRKVSKSPTDTHHLLSNFLDLKGKYSFRQLVWVEIDYW